MRCRILFTAVVGILAGVAFAQPATRPTTRPEVDVGALVQRLGAEDFKDREAAGVELRKLGPAALPDLKAAEKHADPEVQARAGALVREIERAAKRKLRPRPEGWGQGSSSRSSSTITMTVNGRTTTRKTETVISHGRKEVTVSEDGRNVQIVEDSEGIQMLVTDTVGGQEVTKAYEARSAEELKEKEPEAFAMYERYTEQRGRRPVPPRIRFRDGALPPRELPE